MSRHKKEAIWYTLLSLSVFIFLWYAYVTFFHIPSFILPTPTAVAKEMVFQLTQMEYASACIFSGITENCLNSYFHYLVWTWLWLQIIHRFHHVLFSYHRRCAAGSRSYPKRNVCIYAGIERRSQTDIYSARVSVLHTVSSLFLQDKHPTGYYWSNCSGMDGRTVGYRIFAIICQFHL